MARGILKIFVLISALLLWITPPTVNALSASQINVFDSGINYFDVNSGSGGSLCSSDLTVSSSKLSSTELSKIQQNEPVYQQAAQKTNVPWQLLAAVHYRETDLSTTEANLFQIGGYSGPSDFLSQAIAAGKYLQHIVADNLASHRAPLQQSGTDPEEIKDTLYSYNGRASVYADQATKLGFNKNTQPYEGSPYVMNDYDSIHTNMGIITGQSGPDTIDGVDTRLGAFTVYAYLVGASGGSVCGQTSGTIPSGNSQQLAQSIISNNNISFDYGPNGYVAQPFKDLAADKLASNNEGCPSTQVSIHILQEILLLAQNHKVNISSLTTGHPCGNVHTVGRAVDINILDNKHLGAGSGLNQTSLYDVPLSNTLMAVALPALPDGSGFGDCDGHQIPTPGKNNIIFFPDICNHVHTQVPPGA